MTQLGLLSDARWHEWDESTGTYTRREHPEGAILEQRTYASLDDCLADVHDRLAQTVINAETLRGRARAALQANRDFLGNPAPTNAQVLSQVRALTRQMNGLARLITRELGDTD